MASTGLRSTAIRTLSSRLTTRSFHSSNVRATLYNNANAETFKKATQASDRITLVDFYADWCGPCRQLSPVLEKLTEEPAQSGTGLPLDLVKVDIETEEGGEIARQFGISSLPTVVAFREGKPTHKFVGALPAGAVKQFLQGL